MMIFYGLNYVYLKTHIEAVTAHVTVFGDEVMQVGP